MKEITLKLTIEETNNILQSLGNLPFIQVNQLIQKIQQQAGQQLQEVPPSSPNGNGKAKKKELEKALA